jgi:tol-pal system protein YbgF
MLGTVFGEKLRLSFMPVFARASVAMAAIVLTLAGPALAQDEGRSPNFLDNLFGNNNARPPAPARNAGPDEAELTVQIDRLQAQIRQLTGTVEQLQYRNQQLEQQVRSMGGNVPGAGPGMSAVPGGPGMGATPAMPPPRGGPQNAPLANNYPPSNNYPAPANNYPPSGNNYPPAADSYPPPVVTASPGDGRGRRGDVFDPSQNPNAPGAPQVLGSPRSASQPLPGNNGREGSAPVDLSAPGSNPSYGDSQMASVAPPSTTPRDEFDLAAGYIQRKDYDLAEGAFRAYLKKYPSDTRVADAQYYLGESLYQRQRYRDAAESFLTVTTKFERSAKAPESLMRLGQSLAALGEKETACAAWGEIGRKYTNASAAVKKNVAAEQKRVRC